MSSRCVPCKSLLLPPLWCLSRVKSFFSLGRKGGSCFCIHSALTPALPQRQPSLLTVSEMYLCIKGGNYWSGWRITVPPLCLQEGAKLGMKFSQFYFLKAKISISIITNPGITVESVSLFHVDLDHLRSTLAQSSGPLFVSVYVIAWQGSAPSRLCEGLNVIHWAETVLLPASLPFCLTPLMAARYKRGQCHKQSLFIDERCSSVAHRRQDEIDACWGWEGLRSQCVGREGK